MEKIEMKNSWNQITVNEFIQLEQLLQADIPESYRTSHVVALLTNKSLDEIESLTAVAYTALARQLSFISEEPKYNELKDEYIINDRKYILKADLTQISTAQYIDYQNYMKEEEKDVTKLLSCWLIPDGKEYGDGYDMKTVIGDMGDLPLQDSLAICFFFPKQLAAYILILKDSLKKNLKTLAKTEKKITKKQIKQLEDSLNNMASCLWSLPFAKQQ